MIKEKLFEDLYNKIPDKSNLVIFGANVTGEKILKDLAEYKPNSRVLGFIDNIVKDKFHELPVWSLNEFINNRNKDELVIMSTTRDENLLLNIMDLYDVPVIAQTPFVNNYYRKKLEILNEENFKKVIDIFNKEEDKELFDNLFKLRLKALDPEVIRKYYYSNVTNRYKTFHVFRKQYLDKINRTAVKKLFDLGFNDGINVIAYNKLLPNLEKIYGFEAIYDITRKPFVEDFILSDNLEIVPYALGDSNKKINFHINKTYPQSSFGDEITVNNRLKASMDWEIRTVDVITIDNFCSSRKIYPDLIKMDIEGAELSALQGGINTIKKCRPQLAISIYHQQGKDLIDIPLFLKENLEGYKYTLGHYSPQITETILYAIPEELEN